MDHHKLIEKISRIILSELDNINQNLIDSKGVTGNIFAYPDSIGQSHTQQDNLINTQNIIHSELIKLSREPFVAYVRAEVDGKEGVYYICRSYTPSGIQTKEPSGLFVNYRSPMGRIVEFGIDDEDIIYVHGREKEVRVLEKNNFKPKKFQSEWDGIENKLFLVSGKDPISIPSLLDFIKSFVTILEDKRLIKDIQEREKQLHEAFLEKLKIKEGLTREVIDKMELRDQAILDKTQGNIFRLPISSQIILTGAPGTGKTTTLIKRIAQKTNPIYLSDEEKYDLPEKEIADYFNEENWIMFTPTELLKIFLKEAFNNELIPASDRRVKIWDDERTIIGRDVLKFLKTGEKGYFTKTSRQTLVAQSNIDLIDHAKVFIKFYNQFIIDLFYKSYEILNHNNTSPRMRTHFSKIMAEIEKTKFKNEDDKTFSLIKELISLREAFNSKSIELDEQIEQIINGIIVSKTGILDEIYNYIQLYKLDESSEDTDVDEDEFEESEEHIETTEHNIISKRQIKRTLNYYAEKIAANKKIPKQSIHSGVLNIIYSFLPTDEKLSELGKRIIDRKVTNNLTRGYWNLINRIPFYYQKFRMDQLKIQSSFYNLIYGKEIKERKICDLEIDLIIFVTLRNARKIFEKQKELLEINSRVDILENIKDQFTTQILVDEATDFSTIQLGCMYYLSHPRFTSVSLSGDLMQRIYDFGLTDWGECDFINDKFEIHKVNKVYRQSPKLLKIAEVLYENHVKQKPPFHSAFIPNDSDPDPLKFDAQDDQELGKWIANRILEVFNFKHKLPSTAIFVAEDDLIDQAYKIVEEPLNAISISAKACHRGEILGSEGKVRIFSVKYIKGLEFESVFFLNINKIADRTPSFVDKYLYVGLTRAASFLGVVYKNQFPNEIKFVEDYFKEGDWSRFS